MSIYRFTSPSAPDIVITLVEQREPRHMSAEYLDHTTYDATINVAGRDVHQLTDLYSVDTRADQAGYRARLLVALLECIATPRMAELLGIAEHADQIAPGIVAALRGRWTENAHRQAVAA